VLTGHRTPRTELLNWGVRLADPPLAKLYNTFSPLELRYVDRRGAGLKRGAAASDPAIDTFALVIGVAPLISCCD
jgi:hypothetical protein